VVVSGRLNLLKNTKGLSTASCMIRNDFNIIFSFLVLIIFIKYLKESQKFYSKIIIHLMGGLIVADIIWIVIVLPYWTSSVKADIYWNSLSGVHSFALWLSFLEILVKVNNFF
jgi:hypothetical protein